MSDQEDLFLKQKELHDFSRDQKMMESGDAFIQVHEKERKAICKTLPYYVLLQTATTGFFMFTSYKNKQEKSSGEMQITQDQEHINWCFSLLLLVWSGCILGARFMLAIKLPSSNGPRNCMVKFLVFIRIIILLLIVFEVVLFYILAYYTAKYSLTNYKQNLHGTDISYGNAVSICVQLFICIFLMLHVVVFVFAPIKRCFDNRKARGCCSQFSYDITGSIGWFGINIYNFVYPKAVFVKEIEFHSKSMNELREDSQKFDRKTQVEMFLEDNTSKLNTFLELTCPKCEVDLEDGDLVTKSCCNLKCTYHRDCIEEILKAGDDNCVKCDEPIMIDQCFDTGINDTV